MSAVEGKPTISQPKLDPTKPASGKGGPSKKHRHLPIARWVFWPAAALIVAFVLYATIFPASATEVFSLIQSNVIKWFGWYYVAAIAMFVVFALWIGLSRYGDIKLGKDEDKPEF
ncbi:MAG: BCCT family transporter, partial [Renibacterium salmoninarum]|nr:BCCT family transporter [Renibacterium salmoninarum]